MSINPKINILLVDESRGDLTTMRDILCNTGFKNVNYAFSGDEALKIIEDSAGEKTPVQLIIASFSMEEMNGVELYNKIRSSYDAKGMPFLLVSTQSEQAQILTAVKAGIKNILLRPFSRQALINELAKLLK